MKNTYSDLDLVAGLTALTAIMLLALPDWQSPVRVLLGLFLVLFAPGYALYAAMFTRPQHRLEQVVLTLVLSMIITAAIGLALNYMPWGLTLPALAVGLGGFTLAALGVTAWRRGRFNAETVTQGTSRSWLLGVAGALVLLTGLSWGSSQRHPIEASTEFYLLGRNGQLAEYPNQVSPGARLPLELSVTNLEGRPMQYRVQAALGTARFDVAPFIVSNGQKWTSPLEVSAPTTPGRHTLKVDLYRPNDDQPYRQLTLGISVQ